MNVRFASLISSLVFCLFFLLFSLSDVNVAYADLTNEFFATSNGACNNWVDIANSLGLVDSTYAIVSNKIPVCNWNFFTPFNIPTGSEINSIKVRVYYSSSGNSGTSSMSPAYNGVQSCVPPPFFPASIFNNVHEYVVTPTNCPTTFPTLAKLNSSLMSWYFYNSGNITAAIDAISMQVAYTLSTNPTPTPNPTPILFLDLPWDYEGKGLSFNEGALAINSYFDHEYPLLSSSLSEPPSASGTIVNYLGFPRVNKPYSMHDGYDYGTPAKVNLGDLVLAAAAGLATYVDTCGACGNMIVIDHGNGYQTRYLHLQKDGLVINTTSGSIQVDAREKIGKVGSTGNSTGAHIHFGVFQDKNNNGNFEDNVPDGVTDPFGWQSTEPDPWPAFIFDYGVQRKTGNRSYYLWIKPLDNLNPTLTSNGGVFNTERYKLDFQQGSVLEDIKLSIQSSSIVNPLDLRSIGSTLVVNAFDALGNAVTSFTNPFTLTVDFKSIDLSSYDTNTIFIYSSPDGVIWTPELTTVNLSTGIASAVLNHLTHFALMAKRADTIAPTTTAVLNGLQGQANWYRSDVSLNLNPNDNGGLGVDYTLYKIEGGDWATYNEPLVFTQEGHYKIEFYSVDKDENIETVQFQEFDIDKTPPEANIHFDTKIQDLVLIGSDNASQTSIVQTQISKNTKQMVITDKAGNTLLALIVTNRVRGSAVFSISSLIYNPAGTPVDSNKLSIRYQTNKNGTVRSFDQTFEVKGVVQIQLSYAPKTDKTTVTTGTQKITVSGMRILQIATVNGALLYSY